MLGNIEWGYRGVKHNVTEYLVVWLLRAKLKICKSQRENQKGMKCSKKNKRPSPFCDAETKKSETRRK